MPRRYHDYAGFLKQDFFETFHGFSTVGSVILGVGFVIMAIVLLASLFSKKKAPSNPWGGLSMEWMTTSPPPTLNFHYDPVLEHGPYDYDKVTPENL